MEFLTVKDISKMLHVSRWKVYQLLESGDLEGFRIGRQWRVEVKNLNNYVDPGGKLEELRNSLDKAYGKRCPHAHTGEVYDPERMKHFDGPDLCEINGKICILVGNESCIIWDEIKKQRISEGEEMTREEEEIASEEVVPEVVPEEKQTVVVNIKTIPDFDPVENPDDVYIGRSHGSQHGIYPKSKWYNPYKIGKSLFGTMVTREEALEMYKDYIVHDASLMESIHELKGKRLGCWCKPLACHGDILAELVNNTEEER